MDKPLFDYCLRLGDTSLVLGHRLSEWCGHAPELEIDLGLANIALDLIGRSRTVLDHAGRIEGAGRDEDALAYLRDVFDYRNLLLVERPNGDFAQTIVRQFLFDAFDVLLMTELAGSKDPVLAGMAGKAVKESRYHLEFSAGWTVRLGDGTTESHARTQRAVDELWVYTGEMFAMDDLDRALLAKGVAVDTAALRAPWHDRVAAVLAEAGLTKPTDGWMASGGKDGEHSEHLGYLLAEMQFLQRAYPGAEW